MTPEEKAKVQAFLDLITGAPSYTGSETDAELISLLFTLAPEVEDALANHASYSDVKALRDRAMASPTLVAAGSIPDLSNKVNAGTFRITETPAGFHFDGHITFTAAEIDLAIALLNQIKGVL